MIYCILVQLCTIQKGQATIKKMDDNQTRNMVREAAKPADERKKKIMDAVSIFTYLFFLNIDP